MGDMAEEFKAMRDRRRDLRKTLGVNCPTCTVKLPKAHPSILIPGQRCKVCGYRDPRRNHGI